MGKSKNYDIYISPGKWYLYKTRRVLFALSVVLFVLNMIVIASFEESMRRTAIISIILSVLFGVVQFIDNRKVHWDWFYIIVLSAIFLLFSALFAFATELFFMRYIWLGELVFFCVLVPLLLRKKIGSTIRQIPICQTDKISRLQIGGGFPYISYRKNNAMWDSINCRLFLLLPRQFHNFAHFFHDLIIVFAAVGFGAA